MKRSFINILLCTVLALSAYSCKHDWTIKDVPPIPQAAKGFGYVAGFEGGGIVLFAIEVPSDGVYTIAVAGRGINEGTPGSGIISCGDSYAEFAFENYGSWSEKSVQLTLHAGVNDVTIEAGNGNGLFHLDYIELK